MTPAHAHDLIALWEREPHHEAACDFFRPGMFDILEGERICARCRVPLTTHRAYRLLTAGVSAISERAHV